MLNFDGSLRRILSAAGLGLILLVLFSFSNRIAEFTRLTAQEQVELENINQLQQTLAYIEDQIVYATSVAAVEEWAREEARMAQEGDFPVIPLNPNADGSAFAAEPIVEDAEKSNLQIWLQWLFSR
jgi:cell division protein FtsB